MNTAKTILLSAGGTGGHLFPAEALSHELMARGWTVHLATDERANRYAGEFPATAVHAVASATFGDKNPIALARSFWRIWQGVRQASALIAKIKPAAVVGFGGYPTLPPLYAATRRSIPTLIHEQNAVMGRANKALAKRVTAIAGGFLPEGQGADWAKTVVTGNPVRPAVLEASRTIYRPSGKREPFRLLVFGGSQGALFFSEAMPAAVAALPEQLRGRLHITQQARPEDQGAVIDAYNQLNIPAEVSPFFGDMAQRIASAHLVICRSGASMKMPQTIGLVHFIGIGGIGMSGIAEVLHNLGYRCRARTRPTSANVQRLRDKGIECFVGHRRRTSAMREVVVVSTAIKRSNPELMAAREKLLPVVRRAEMLAELMRFKLRRYRRHAWQDHDDLHGRDAARSRRARSDRHQWRHHQCLRHQCPHGRGRMDGGRGRRERRHFLKLPADVAIVTNIDPEHLDHYGTFDRVREAFRQFVENVPFYGFGVMCTDHPEVQALVAADRGPPVITYGANPQADVRFINHRMEGATSRFDV
jgi:UDP-N-acetylglucosamine--N-acetylmuramyl-(pentapeptide) pyrophosphoryl-undecaprenol N-acetylglucosamine transferase